jgi:hypothetical protein
VEYYFAIEDAEKAKNNEEKVNLKQLALFNYAIGHFANKPELVSKLQKIKEKVEK